MNRKILFSFFRRRRGMIFLYLLLFIVSLVTFLLYDLPAEPILYTYTLCALVGLIYTVLSFMSYRKKYTDLMELKNRITVDISSLPTTCDCIEECFLDMITSLFNEAKQLEYEADKSYNDLMDYYTLWAHQIKVPLSALKLLLQSNGIENKEIKGELFKIEQYVSLVLQYLRLDSLSSDLVLAKYPLDTVVRQAVRNYSSLFIAKEVSLDLHELGADVLTDEKWLVFVIEQIISNSLKYTRPKGKISIYMHSASTLAITDTGIGISPENLSRVFDRGFTGYNGRSDMTSTGLGLFLCKRVLTKLSHSIEIQSQPGKGTTVLIGLDSIPLLVE